MVKLQSKTLPDLVVPDDNPVDDALLEKVALSLTQGVSDIEVQHRMGKNSWVVLARVEVEPGDEPDDIARALQTYADRHHERSGTTHFRAQIRAASETKRGAPRTYVRFGPSESQQQELTSQEGWAALFDQQHRFCERLMDVALTRAEDDQARRADSADRESQLVREMMGPAVRSMRVQQQSMQAELDARMEAQTARMAAEQYRLQGLQGSREDAEFWALAKPVVATIGTQIAGRLAAPPPDAERRQVVTTVASETTLRGLARSYLDSLGLVTVLRIVRALPEIERSIKDLDAASDDAQAARAVVGLQTTILANPQAQGEIQHALGERIKGLMPLVAMAQRELSQRKQ